MKENKIFGYQNMMLDETRMLAYQSAIRRVCPGRVVCEIGVGLGPLSLMALQSGAKRVYGIEVDHDVLKVATRVIRSNGFGADRFVPIPGLSCEVELPERVDVLVFEIFDSLLFCENVLPFVDDARDRFLKPAGVLIPQRVTSKAALATPALFDEQRDFWTQQMKERFGLDYSAFDPELRNNNKRLVVKPHELHSRWTDWSKVEFADPSTYELPGPIALRVTRAGQITGFCVGFDAELSEGIHLRTFPENPKTHWEQGFVPFKEPPFCRQGDLIYVDVDLEVESDMLSEITPRLLHLRGPRVRDIIHHGQHMPASSAPPRVRAGELRNH